MSDSKKGIFPSAPTMATTVVAPVAEIERLCVKRDKLWVPKEVAPGDLLAAIQSLAKSGPSSSAA